MGSFECGGFECRRWVSFLNEVVSEVIFEFSLMHVVEENLGGVSLVTSLFLKAFDGTIDLGDGVADVRKVLDLRLEGVVPCKVFPHFLEFVLVGSVVEELVDSEGSDGNVGAG